MLASYFVFYKSWLKSLGNEVAKLSTREQLTELEEIIKKDFNEKLESYKNKLNEELVALLDERNFISSFKVEGGSIRVNTRKTTD